jgi:hypothetical protein
MSRHLRLIAVCAGLLASAGCSGERRLPTAPTSPSPTGPTEPAPPQPSASQRLAAFALLEAVNVHQALTTSPLTSASWDGRVVWTNGPCLTYLNGRPEAYGSLEGSLDGNLSPTSGTFLPIGSHTYVVSFSNCLVDGWAGTLTGVASAAYSAAEWSNVTAKVSADAVRGWHLASVSELRDVTAHGSAVWTREGSASSTRTMTYTPAAGSRVVNNLTRNVATFGGGSYSTIQYPATGTEQRFDNLKVAINGTEYTLNGRLDTLYGSSGSNSHTGEVRIINNGTLVARIYGDGGRDLKVEVLVPLGPL